MYPLLVHAFSGHYKVPGAVDTAGLASSYPVAPVSTARGFLESLAVETPGSFQGRFAYGLLREPSSYGHVYRSSHIWSSSGQKGSQIPGHYRLPEEQRPFAIEVFFDMEYVFLVEGPWEEKIRDAVAGKTDRYGVLSLGSSDDPVTHLGEYTGPLDAVKWVVPGNTIPLPVHAPYGYHTVHPTVKVFDLRNGDPVFHEVTP